MLGQQEFQFLGDQAKAGSLAIVLGKEALSLEDIPIVRDFMGVFPLDIP